MSSILIVEDERLVAKDIEESLRGLGYEIAGSAASAHDALAQAAAKPPDLVLMDVRISGELDGVETARLLRQRFGTPVVYITAYTDRETVERARETEPYGYIVKPFDASELHCAIEIALFKRQMELKLEEREHWFATTLRSIADAVVAVDPAGSVTFMNLAAEALLGRNAEKRRFSDLVQLIDETTRKPVDNPLERALAERKPGSIPRGTALLAEHGEIPIEDSAAPIVDDNGNLLGAVLVFRDVAEKRRLEQGVSVAQRMTSLGTLSAGVAHEINNPLAYVMANAEFVAEELTSLRSSVRYEFTDPSTVREEAFQRINGILGAVQEIEQGADRIARIVRDLKVFSRPANREGSSVDLLNALEWAIRVTSTEVRHRASLIKNLAPVPRVAGDDARLGQVFVNLLTNAVHAMPEGRQSDNVIVVSSETDAEGYAVIRVRDNGTGIDPAVTERIFDPFFTTKPTATSSGLGLAICHSIVTTMGGGISVSTAPGLGTTMSVRLPPAPVPSSMRPVSIPTPALRRARILLVDDEPMIVDALRRILGETHAVEGVTSATAALELLGADPEFDLIFCDLMMPGMTGMDLYDRVLERMPEIAQRFVFMTGGAFAPRAAEFLERIPNPCLDKPVRAREIEAFIQTFMEKRCAAPPVTTIGM